jgi:predicted ArsR family transcriptional regulator
MVRPVGPEQLDAADSGAVLLASPARRAILQELQRFAEDKDDPVGAGGMTAARLADEICLHVTTVRFHLDQLELAGLVLSHFTTAFGVGRPRKVYVAAPRTPDPASSASHLKLLAGLLTKSFSADLSPSEAGEQWAREHVTLRDDGPATTPGGWLTKLGRLIDVLQKWGYTPNLTTTDGGRACRIDLVDCPFRDLARANPDVVCGIHRGLLSGVLDQLGEDQVEVSLQPFVGPSLCHAFVSTQQPFQDTTEEPPDES